jgi:hypothetical protein
MAQQPESSGKTSSRSNAAASAATTAGNAGDQNPVAGSGAATPKAGQPLTARRGQFMVASQHAPGLAPLSADIIEQSLSQAPGVEIVKTVRPPAALGLQALTVDSVFPGGINTATGAMVVARMTPDKAELLKNQAAGRLVVEHDTPLTYGLDPGPLANIPNVGVLKPLADGFKTTIEVVGPQGPLKDADVFLFGSMLPAQATTDASGRAELEIVGESPDTIRALYVKPRVDYWDLWMTSPALAPDGVNTVTVKPLSSFIEGFPDKQLLGWGQRAMGLDQVPTSFDGAGIKVAIIDSGAAQVTHRNLHRVGPGFDVVGNNKTGWTNDTVGHGSHCAGVIAGNPSGSGIRGFAPAAEIHVLRIFPGARFSDLVGALDYCMENGIDVVNMSLGGGEPSKIVEDRLVKAKSMGVACIIAAGNSGGPVQFPASTVHALAVSAIGKSGEFPPDSFHATQMLQGFEGRPGFFPAKFSCFGPEIDVCAPGVAIVSSLPPDDFGAWDGTSMATPHVTGMAALVLAHHPDFKGQFAARNASRVERLYQIIKETATPMPISDPTRVGVGLPNVARALGLQLGQGPQAAAASPGTDPALAILRQLLQSLATQGQTGQPISVGLTPQSVNPTPLNGLSSIGEARDLLHRAGLL